MRNSLFIILLAGYCFSARCQSTAGLTGKRDTSFTTYSAFMSTRKNFTDIRIVPEIHSDAVIEKRDIPYCKIGTRSLYLDQFYPGQKGNVLHPSILIIHGGGWRTGNRTQHYPLAQRLAAMGYVCFTPEYRLSTEALYPAAVDDLKSALRWMHANASRLKIDTTKIVVLGFSAGGELAAFIGATSGKKEFDGNGCNLKSSSLIQAVVDIDGTLSFVHPESGEGDDSRSTSAATYWFGYARKDNPKLWQEASPLSHVGRNTPPVLFLNSSVERMHAGREDFIRELNKYSIYFEVHSFPGAPHAFCLFDPWFEPTVKYIGDFLERVLKK